MACNTFWFVIFAGLSVDAQVTVEEEAVEACSEGRQMVQMRTSSGKGMKEKKRQRQFHDTANVSATDNYFVLSGRMQVQKCPGAGANAGPCPEANACDGCGPTSHEEEMSAYFQDVSVGNRRRHACNLWAGFVTDQGRRRYSSFIQRRRRLVTSLEIDASNDFVIVDTGADEVRRCTPGTKNLEDDCVVVAGGGQFVVSHPGWTHLASGSGLNELIDPTAVAIDENGDYIIVDSGNFRVQKCPPNQGSNCCGEFGATCSTVAGDATGAFTPNKLYKPNDIAIDAAGNYIFASKCGVQKCPPAPHSDCITMNGTPDCQEGFEKLRVAIDVAGDYIVTEKHRILKCFAASPVSGCITLLEGTACETFGPENGETCSDSEKERLITPLNVAINSAGELLIADESGDVWKCSYQSTGLNCTRFIQGSDLVDIAIAGPTPAPTPVPTPAPTPVPSPEPTPAPTPAPTYVKTKKVCMWNKGEFEMKYRLKSGDKKTEKKMVEKGNKRCTSADHLGISEGTLFHIKVWVTNGSPEHDYVATVEYDNSASTINPECTGFEHAWGCA